jgi:quercetin dioxygenase-like cupin family protein
MSLRYDGPHEGVSLPCVAGGVALGAALGIGLAHLWSPASCKKEPVVGPCGASGLWAGEAFTHPKDTPSGFTMRDTGFDTFLEKWEPGDYEPPHSHPGDDATILIEGSMEIQFYTRVGKELVQDGDLVRLRAGQTGFIKGGRIHDARYITKCKLVYVHNSPFAFNHEQ